MAVSRDAAFLRVEDADDFRSALIDLVTKAIGDAAQKEPLRGFVPRKIGQDASDDRLDGVASMRWGWIVRLWSGRALTLGEATHWTETQIVPSAGQPTIRWQYQAEFVGRVPCSAGESIQRCVELGLIAEVAAPDRQAYAEAVQRSAKGARFEYPEMRIELRLVAAPDTLLPYSFRQSTREGIKMINERSTMETQTQDDLELIYTYQ